jgi:hypothetical protein
MIGVVLLMTMVPAQAELDDDEPGCPAVLGDSAAREANRLRREESFEVVEYGEGGAAIIHSGEWADPTPIHFEGVTVVAIDTAEHTAIVRLELPGICDGTFELPVDAELGAEAQVVAVVDQAVVLEHRGKLRYLQVLGDESVDLEAVWSSAWAMRAPAGATRAAPPPAPPPRKR